MFVRAIEMASAFTRPIHSISRVWGSTTVVPGSATLFFVNADGWALTCKHVATQLTLSQQLLQRFASFKAERANIPVGKKSKQLFRALERKHGLTAGVPVEIYNNFVNCVEGPLELEACAHPSADVALLKFKNFTRLGASAFPVFARDGQGLKQGKFLCRLGFPFPEFTNFEYDQAAEQIRWTTSGRRDTPQFPIEGMLTRLVSGPGGVAGFELSTPGLRGQSGGPAFDAAARIWGMQAATAHLDLDFDVDMDVIRNGQTRRLKDSAFLHVGHCVHVDVLKQFMRDNNVAFCEG
ncbi:MAG: trypsin-like peptidase domain-containing protein [Pseudomonadota bacterium]